jgi:hypothetical protein
MARVRFAVAVVRRDRIIANFAVTRRLDAPRFRIETYGERWNAHRYVVRSPTDLAIRDLPEWVCESYHDLGMQGASRARRTVDHTVAGRRAGGRVVSSPVMAGPDLRSNPHGVPGAPAPSVRELDVNGTTLYAEVRGSGPPALIIPGGAAVSPGTRSSPRSARRSRGHARRA